MNYRNLLKELQKLSEVELNQFVKVYDHETDTIIDHPSFEIGPDNTPYITIN